MQSPIHTSATIKLCISIVAFTTLTLSGCGGGGGNSGGGTIPNNTVQMGGARQGTPLTLTNTVSTFAGTVSIEGGWHDDTGTAAIFKYPHALTTDGSNLYVADTNTHTIRKIVIASGVVTTLAGSAGNFGISDSTDGKGPTARFNSPQGLTTDGTYLYVADTGNHTIRQVVIETGAVTTLVGANTSGTYDSIDGTGATARFKYPEGITTDGANLYVSDSLNNTVRKVVIATGEVTT